MDIKIIIGIFVSTLFFVIWLTNFMRRRGFVSKISEADKLFEEGKKEQAFKIYREAVKYYLKSLQSQLEAQKDRSSLRPGSDVIIYTGTLLKLSDKLSKIDWLNKEQEQQIKSNIQNIEQIGKKYSMSNMSKEDAEICLIALDKCVKIINI